MPPAGATLGTSFHLKVTAAFLGFLSTCPFDEDGGVVPGTECTDVFFIVAQESAPQEGTGQQPWHLVVIESHVLIHSNEDVELLHERFGVLEDPPELAIDSVHLRYASVAGVVPMDDGSRLAVDLIAEQAGALHVDGMDGPIDEPGVPWGEHIRDECSTQNWLAHQVWRADGSLTGTIAGHDVADLYLTPGTPFLGRGVFTINIATHANCA